MKVVSLPDALKRRASLILQAVADRSNSNSKVPIGKHFKGYKAREGLVGEFSHLGDILYCTYKRPRDVDSKYEPAIRFYDFKMTNIKEVKRSESSIIQDNIEEKHLYSYNLPDAISYTKTFEHEFQRTTSFSEAAAQAWKVAAKASLGVEFSGVKASVEISGEYGEQYNQSHSESTTKTDKISEVMAFTGPIRFKLEAFRSRRRERVLIDAVADFTHQIAIDPGADENGIIYWKSFRTDFLPTIRRTNTNDATYYKEFMDNPMSDKEIKKIEESSDKVIEYVVEYDNVISESLEPLHSDVTKM